MIKDDLIKGKKGDDDSEPVEPIVDSSENIPDPHLEENTDSPENEELKSEESLKGDLEETNSAKTLPEEEWASSEISETSDGEDFFDNEDRVPEEELGEEDGGLEEDSLESELPAGIPLPTPKTVHKSEPVTSYLDKPEDLTRKVEALLFSIGKKIDVSELCELVKANTVDVIQSLNELKKQYEDWDNSLMVVNEGESWKLSVKEKYLVLVKNIVTETELSKSLMETLAVIAFKHPALQADIIKIRTNKAYDHMRELEDMGYITRIPYGRTKRVGLTQKFFNYFDLPPSKLKSNFSHLESVDKAIDVKEGEAEQLKDDHRKMEEDIKKSQEEMKEKEKELVGSLEVYDTLADKLGKDPSEFEDDEEEEPEVNETGKKKKKVKLKIVEMESKEEKPKSIDDVSEENEAEDLEGGEVDSTEDVEALETNPIVPEEAEGSLEDSLEEESKSDNEEKTSGEPEEIESDKESEGESELEDVSEKPKSGLNIHVDDKLRMKEEVDERVNRVFESDTPKKESSEEYSEDISDDNFSPESESEAEEEIEDAVDKKVKEIFNPPADDEDA